MKILITGANGMVARATAQYCKSIGDSVTALTRNELDISALGQVSDLVGSLRPDAIINCAAYTDVDGSETQVERCFAANSTGVANLALAARQVDARFVTISTDYVFDGEKDGFYTQRETPNPLGAYARAKLEGENRARDSYARSIIVRTGWIYGNGGTNFLSVMADLLGQGKSIKAIYDSFGTPTYSVDLARRLRELAELDMPCVFHVTNSGDGTSYAGFAEKVCDLMGYDRKLLEPAAAETLKRPAPRPPNCRLTCLFSEQFGLAPLPDWEDALKRFLIG
ncbi:MAG: dTDP-4-dehydrorhamnose reductase [Acidobacteria bacterium]|nr:dTDP-4-dehydrorhamnose reductase [Acidobacteriota bacterium]